MGLDEAASPEPFEQRGGVGKICDLAELVVFQRRPAEGLEDPERLALGVGARCDRAAGKRFPGRRVGSQRRELCQRDLPFRKQRCGLQGVQRMPAQRGAEGASGPELASV